MPTQKMEAEEVHMPVRIGRKVPNLAGKAYQAGAFKNISLADYRGKWVVLFFYPRDFTFVCPTEINSFAEHESEFKKRNAVIIGASTDSEHSHKAWFERDLPNVKYPIVADTTHSWAKTMGVLKEEDGMAFRGTFIIDPMGVLRYAVVADIPVGRSIDETVRTLSALQTGELCPVEWKPGMKTLGK